MGEFPNKEAQFAKGQSGNPGGRPKGSRNRQTLVREMLERAALETYKKKFAEELPGDNFEQKTIADQVVAALIVNAINGDAAAARELLDSGFGKLKETVKNEHVFTKMPTAQLGEGTEAKELTFDVGSEVKEESTDE